MNELQPPNSLESIGPEPEVVAPPVQERDVILQADELFLSYGDEERGQTHVLKGLSWRLRAGEWWWVMGPSGCGKTSLGKVLSGLVVPQSGTIYMDGEVLAPCLKQRPPQHRRALQYLFQHGSRALNPARSLASQLKEAFDDPDELAAYLKDLSLDHLQLKAKPALFSLGEIQRLNLLRALAYKPRVIVGDELLSALDLSTKAAMIRALNTYLERNRACVALITHNINPNALREGRILYLSKQSRPHLEDVPESAKADYWFSAV